MSQEIGASGNGRFVDLLLESMAEGVFTLDVHGKITRWNPAMERITGYTEAEALGRTCELLSFNQCFDQSCPGDAGKCGILKGTRIEAKECVLRHKGGFDIPVLKNARAIKVSDGTIIGVVETLTDLSRLKRAELKVERASRLLEERHGFGNIVGKSHRMQVVFESMEKAAASNATVLIQGESGTGKELAAGAIHFQGSRKNGPLVTVNCSALPEALLESELFGHVRGSFTGALRDRIGRFEEADGGTLFLDEVGAISPYIQVKLLRVLQEREFERVGESRKRTVDIRIIAATNRDLFEMVREGAFREDLYYRLRVFPISLPPLRERKEDIPLLAAHFLERQNRKTGKRIQGVASSAMGRLMDYPWPGNVRELENAVEHAFVLCESGRIDLAHLPLEIREYGRQPTVLTTPPSDGRNRSEKLTREGLLELLESCDWNKAEVARRIGRSRTAVWKYMKKWGLPLRK
jgi:PAS domain S-box-containing protein